MVDTKVRKTAAEQVKKFRDTARTLECDEDETAFDRTLKRVAKALPAKEEKPKRAKAK